VDAETSSAWQNFKQASIYRSMRIERMFVITEQQAQKQPIARNQSKYRNIIFDMGGVLIYWKPKEIIADLFKEELENLGTW